jgi:uncharacterized membrane protein (TIGR02234 family)
MNRRSYALTLVACLAGAGLALYAVTRTWSLHVTPRTGMSDLRTVRAGADVEPWVIGLALVALAGTGALLATRGWARRTLGALLTLVGLGVAAGAIIGRAGLDTGQAGPGGTFWPAACALGGAIIAVGGLTAARRGHLWPGMSARYERKPVPSPRAEPGAESAPRAAAGRAHGASSPPTPPPAPPADPLTPQEHRAAWDALDRGDDPTVV